MEKNKKDTSAVDVDKSKKAIRIAISVLIALVFWFYVDEVKEVNVTTTVHDIPVEFSGEDTALADNGLMLLSGGMLFLFAPELVGLFSKDPQVTKLSVTVLRMVAVSEPFYGVPIVLEGLMQGIGKTTIPFLFNIAGMWGVRILGTFLCTRLLGMGLVSAWGCMIGHNLLLFVLFTVYYAAGKALPKAICSE